MTDLNCFIDGVNESLFNLHNLPYGIFSTTENHKPRVGCRLGDWVLDLSQLEAKHLLHVDQTTPLFSQATLNTFAEQGIDCWKAVRHQLQLLLTESAADKAIIENALTPIDDCQMHLPFSIQGFTDFYAGEHHARNVGKLFRGADELLPNWKHLPVAYNGRASTVFVSGTPVPRPNGLIKPSPDEPPLFSASQKLDYELELGAFVGLGNPDGQPISVHQASDHLFGCVLLNDWSARDIQAFEYQPLGPFLGKSFATSISPWVVSMLALEPFMQSLPTQDPKPCSYLYQETPFMPEINLQVELIPANSHEKHIICQTKSTELYWNLSQMLAHHSVNHCIMKPGDLFGTGTISGQAPDQVGSLLERTLNGREPIQFEDGMTRGFLQEGDTVIMSGYCEANGQRIGFGTVEGKII